MSETSSRRALLTRRGRGGDGECRPAAQWRRVASRSPDPFADAPICRTAVHGGLAAAAAPGPGTQS